MSLDISNVLKLLTTFLAVFFSFYLFTTNSKRKISNVFIAIFLLLLGINLSGDFIGKYLDTISVNFSVFLTMTVYFAAPSFYLYIKSSMDPEYRIAWKDTFHLLPFILFNLFIFKSVYLVNIMDIPEETGEIDVLTKVLFIGFYLQLFFYMGISLRLLKKRRLLYEENYSNTDIRRYKYLVQLTSLMTIIFILSAIKNFLIYNVEGEVIDYAVHLVLISILLLFCWITMKGLKSPEFFQEKGVYLESVNDILKSEQIVKNNISNSSPILDEQAETHISELKDHMLKNEPYLNPTLSLHELAEQMNLPSRDLSLLINHRLDKHFFEFVNEYRLNKAEELLLNTEWKKKTVLEILYHVGFNSKSSFNTSFKKKTGLTPSEYRNKLAKAA